MYSDNDSNTSVQEELEVVIEARNNVDEAELSRYNFKMPLIHEWVKLLWIFLGCFIAAVNILCYVLINAGLLCYNLLFSFIFGPSEFKLSDHPLYSATLFLLIIHLGVDFYFKFVASYPEVRGTVLYFEGIEYHYSEIIGINATVIHRTTVYLPDGKKIILSGDYDNYGKFMKWAERCRIPITCSQ